MLDEDNLGAREFTRENEAAWLNAYKFSDPRQNPVTQAFAELDSRKTP